MSGSSDRIETSPAFAQLTKDNNGPIVIVASYIFVIISLLSVAVKIWTRIQTTQKLIWNDIAMLAASVLAVGQTIALTVSVRHGLGRHSDVLTTSQIDIMSKAYYASNVLLVACLAGAKVSITLLIISIRPSQNILRGCYGVLGFAALWAVVFIFALSFQCSLPQPWVLGPQECMDQYGLQLSIGITNILSDLAIIALTFFMMQTVMVSTQQRWVVIGLFGLRIVTPACAILALVTSHAYFYSTPQDRTWHLVAPTLWMQAMLNTSIITACIPSIKRFLADMQSGIMAAGLSEHYEQTHSGGKGTYGSHTHTRGLSFSGKFGLSSSGSSGLRSRIEKNTRQEDHDVLKMKNIATRESGESARRLTGNVILQTIDYTVEDESIATDNSEGGKK
ncbi:hypothetical protein DV736_g6498, partial [Chaetothyriales sp. CBS 134916]